MDIVLDRKELIKYPFLKESQQLARRHVESLEEFLTGSPGAAALERAKERVVAAVTFKKEFGGDEDTRNLKPELEIASYALARMLVSCIGDRSLIDRLARYEAESASFFLAAEEPEIRRFVAKSVGIDTRAVSMPVTRYVELVPHLRDKRWRLVNREVRQGGVNLEAGEIDELIRERIRAIIADQLPLRVPGGDLRTSRAGYRRDCRAAAAAGPRAVRRGQGGGVPALHRRAHPGDHRGNEPDAHGSVRHHAFLHTIGLNVAQIADVFARAPDFDPDMTMYQVEHISGRGGGTEYTPPSCATMRTFGLCANRDKDCERVNHPLSYYRFKKNIKKKRS